MFVREEVAVLHEAAVHGSNNDRLIVLWGMGIEDVRRRIASFLDAFARVHPTRVINLVRVGDTTSAICFPKGISFDTFCLLTAYLSQTDAPGIDVTAWATIANTDRWIMPQHIDTGIMLRYAAAAAQVPAVDIATQAGQGYTFATATQQLQPLAAPSFAYAAPPVSMKQLHTLPTIRV